MNHNKFNLFSDIINPVFEFLRENKLIENEYGYIDTQVFFNHRLLTDYFKGKRVGKKDYKSCGLGL